MARGSPLVTYAIARIGLAAPMLLILLTAVFIILRILPGDPVFALWGGRVPPPDAIERARIELGLDQPVWIQYLAYISNILRGELGTSIGELYRGQSVAHHIFLRLPATIELAISSMFVAVVVGVTTGILAGSRRDSRVDVAVRLYGTIVYVIPIFWLGLLFQLIFGVWLGWFPPNGRWTGTDFPTRVTGLLTVDALLMGDLGRFQKAVAHLVLPSLTLGLVLSGFFTKTVRANMLQTMRADYTDAARARGVAEGLVIRRHAFRNALVPVVTVLGLQFAILFSGAVLTERTFSIEGIGILLLNSIVSKDMTMIQGVVVVYATIIVGISLVIDILGALIDPRIRL